MNSFTEMGLSGPILRALSEEKHEVPTPIQAKSVPHITAGRDLLGCAKTGTGKTAAFALPMLQRLSAANRPPERKSVRALVMTPTRELANQVAKSFKTYGRHLRLSVAVVYGGVGTGAQAATLARGVDILVATPGRLLDLMNRRLVSLGHVEVVVLDEADRMLDMGFIGDIRKIVAALPSTRQSLFFSATMPPQAAALAASFLKDPIRVEADPISSVAAAIDQKVMFVESNDKETALFTLLEDKAISRVLVFTRTKWKANKIALSLNRRRVTAEAIHGDRSQGARMEALRRFSDGRARVLVATDVASRGIDIKGVTHVINYELPNEPESYVHRIGRTARAGESGTAISFCSRDETGYLRDIEKMIKKRLATHGEDKGDHRREVPAHLAPKPAKSNLFAKRGFRGFHDRGPRRQDRSAGKTGTA